MRTEVAIVGGGLAGLALAARLHAAGVDVRVFEARARRHWRRTGYYRLLARFLFFAAEPERRVDVFQRFYGLGQGLIERFYAARSPLRDQVRVLWGKPPVSIPRAIKAIFQRGKPLKSGQNPDMQATSNTEPAA